MMMMIGSSTEDSTHGAMPADEDVAVDGEDGGAAAVVAADGVGGEDDEDARSGTSWNRTRHRSDKRRIANRRC